MLKEFHMIFKSCGGWFKSNTEINKIAKQDKQNRIAKHLKYFKT